RLRCSLAVASGSLLGSALAGPDGAPAGLRLVPMRSWQAHTGSPEGSATDMLPDPGVPADGQPAADSGPDADAVPSSAPKPFQEAISSLLTTGVRAEARVERIRPPQRLAPWSFAVAVDIGTPANPDCATGRLVVLYDPDGAEAWDGEIRLVAFASAELAPDMAGDPLLPAVGWSWLTESLEHHNAEHTAVGGTVTQT